MDQVTATTAELMKQASMTASDYMRQAISDIDEEFGEGYAKKHPELVSGMVQAAATDFATAIHLKALQDIITYLPSFEHQLITIKENIWQLHLDYESENE